MYNLRSNSSPEAIQNSQGNNNTGYKIPVNITIKDFDGSQNVDYFLDNIKSMKTLNNWNEEVALLCLKSKLTGAAQEYFMNTVASQNIKTFDEGCKALQNFFKPQSSATSNLFAFQSITLQPGETLKNLGYRIENLAQKAYTRVKDKDALNQIKAFQFLQAIPHELRRQVINESHLDFKGLVDKTATIATNINSLNLFSYDNTKECINLVESTNVHNSLEKKVNELSLKVDNLKNNCGLCGESHILANCSMFKSLISNNSTNSLSYKKNVQCHFCGKEGHYLLNCKEFANSNNKKNDICGICGDNHNTDNCSQFLNVTNSEKGHSQKKPNFRFRPYQKRGYQNYNTNNTRGHFSRGHLNQ